jgi:hypothetical protein
LSGYSVYDTIPTSFIISAGNEDAEYLAFLAKFKDIAKGSLIKECVPPKHCQKNMWLIKPANMNQGRGIEVIHDLKDAVKFLDSRERNSAWVLQKYIEKPLLYTERKFDLRLWVLMTCKNELFLYQEGYMRTSSDVYNTENKNNYVHLTNNCLQKHGDNYGKWEDGNTLSFQTLEAFLKDYFKKDDLDLTRDVLTRIKDIMIDTYLSVKKILNPNKRTNVFELFGYDFLIDEDLRVWLLEVHLHPSLPHLIGQHKSVLGCPK